VVWKAKLEEEVAFILIVMLTLNLTLNLTQTISQLPNLFIDTPRICNFILLLIVWVYSFSKMLPSVKFGEDKVLVFIILLENAEIVQLSSLTLILTLISRAD